MGVVIFGLPLYLLRTGRQDTLVRWICLTVTVNIFDPRLFVNLPAARIAGLLLLPSSLSQLREIRETRGGKLILLYLIYLALLGLLLGFVFPWPSAEFARSFNQRAQGRAIIYLIRTAADVSLAIFVSQYLLKTQRPDRIAEYLLGGACFAALGGLLDQFTRIDPFRVITGAPALDFIDINYRIRGFSYEPRGLGLVAAYGLVISILLYVQKRSRKRLGVISLQGLLLFFTVSTSAVFALVAGLAALFVSLKRSRRTVALMAGLGTSVLIVLLIATPAAGWLQTWQDNMLFRLTTDKGGDSPRSAVEDFALRLDIHDAGALLFLVSSPLHLVFGAGPGLVTLPATDYVPEISLFQESMMQEGGINTEPSMGIVREVADVGVLGLTLWFLFVVCCMRSLVTLGRSSPQYGNAWTLAGPLFLVGAAIYFVQASTVSAIWPIFIGIGLAGERVLRAQALAPAKSELLASKKIASRMTPLRSN